MYKQDTKNSFVDNICYIFKDNCILQIILIFRPSYTSLILETVLIKFGGLRAEDRHIRPKAEGREIQIPFFDIDNKEFIQKEPSRGVPTKSCSENMQQIYRRTPMPKCDFNKVY